MMLGNRPMSEWIARYEQSHQHPVNRLCHTFGIPLIAISLLLFVAAVIALAMGHASDAVVILVVAIAAATRAGA